MLLKLCMAGAMLMCLQVCIRVCEVKVLYLLLLMGVCGVCIPLSVGNMCLGVFRLYGTRWEV